MAYFVADTADYAARVVAMSFDESFLFRTSPADFTVLMSNIMARITFIAMDDRLAVHNKIRAAYFAKTVI